MDEHLGTDTSAEPVAADAAVMEEKSAEYAGRWNRLVSTTNWEKGRIISQWRQSLMQAGGPPQSWSDEAWSGRVGGVSPQHVGRLRRVYEQFGEVYPQYPGLYWSHFQAATDWNDAEMWLEGAVQSEWSVAQMRAQRWEALGAPADQKPRPEDVIATELDEDAGTIDDRAPRTLDDSLQLVHDPGAEPFEADAAGSVVPFDELPPAAEATIPEPVRPFENLPELPADLRDAFEAFKLAILNHKLSGWREISCDHVLSVLDALKQLALAPADG